jgi:hypothetical protein
MWKQNPVPSKGKGMVFLFHAMKAYRRNRRIDPRILNLGARQRWGQLRAQTAERSPPPQAVEKLSEKIKSLAPTRIRNQDRPARPSTRADNHPTPTPVVVVYKSGDLTLLLARSYLHFTDSFESRPCHRLSWQFLGGLRQYLHAHSRDVPRLSRYVTYDSFDILNSFVNDQTRAAHKFRATDRPGDRSLSGGA